ncbi:hypothetical protein JB92DRAFT_3219927 [Gautieria morchelliformis]|nr:hypothetical protein JB92DRAFT_3219927 [Gautieria morchelliformis]
MSPLQVNLSSKEIATAYQSVLDGTDIDGMLLAYNKGSNDLKVESQGSGGLEELEEISDRRCIYAFVRVKIPMYTQPSKFVKVNWCGDGVPEVKKGLFRTLTSSSVICIHSSAVARYLEGTHVVNASTEVNYLPKLYAHHETHKGRIWCNYSVHNETTRSAEPIAPVGTNYTPVGKVDMGGKVHQRTLISSRVVSVFGDESYRLETFVG